MFSTASGSLGLFHVVAVALGFGRGLKGDGLKTLLAVE